MQSKLIFGLLLILVFSSCRKEYNITGRVYNAVTNEGVENVEVEFFRNIKSSDEDLKKNRSALTDQNGNYVLNPKANIRKPHMVRINGLNDTNYFLIGNSEHGLYQKTNTYQLDLGIAKIVSTNFFYKDSSMASFGPEKTLTLQFKHKSITGFYLNGPFVVRNDFSLENYVNLPMLEGWTYITGVSERMNGSTVNFVDSIYCPGNFSVVVNHHKSY